MRFNRRCRKPVNLRADPFEQHMQAPDYPNYAVDKLWTVLPMQAAVEQHLATFKEFPQRQKSGDFNMDDIIKSVMRAAKKARGGGN